MAKEVPPAIWDHVVNLEFQSRVIAQNFADDLCRSGGHNEEIVAEVIGPVVDEDNNRTWMIDLHVVRLYPPEALEEITRG